VDIDKMARLAAASQAGFNHRSTGAGGREGEREGERSLHSNRAATPPISRDTTLPRS
jgi:hypothetical protein